MPRVGSLGYSPRMHASSSAANRLQSTTFVQSARRKTCIFALSSPFFLREKMDMNVDVDVDVDAKVAWFYHCCCCC